MKTAITISYDKKDIERFIDADLKARGVKIENPLTTYLPEFAITLEVTPTSTPKKRKK
jgi:hypothetical protein